MVRVPKLIIIDPGHGGLDPGASGGGLVEKAINWDLANKLKAVLADYEADIEIVQPSCNNPASTSNDEIYRPPAMANELNADFYLSLHVNAGGGQGFESYVHPASKGGEADRIRDAIHFRVKQYLTDRGVKDRGKKYANFAVLRLTKMPAVLLENLFIDNSEDAALLADPIFRWGLVLAIAWGLILALGLKQR